MNNTGTNFGCDWVSKLQCHASLWNGLRFYYRFEGKCWLWGFNLNLVVVNISDKSCIRTNESSWTYIKLTAQSTEVQLDLWFWHVYILISSFRDSREEVKRLSTEERKEIASKEGSRVNRLGTTVSTYSPRKERALKIYVDTSPRRNDDAEVDWNVIEIWSDWSFAK